MALKPSISPITASTNPLNGATSTNIRAINSTRTIIGSSIAAAVSHSIPQEFLANTTQNQHHDIQNGVYPPAGDYTELRYFALGVGNHYVNYNAPFPTLANYGHETNHNGLYTQIPVVLREKGNDLTPEQRINYRFRKTLIKDGVEYWAYFMKVLPPAPSGVELNHITIENGVRTVEPYIPTAASLTPPPPTVPNEGVIPVTSNSLTATYRIDIVFNEFDLAEIRNVFAVLYGDPDNAMFSEVALVYGADKVISTVGDNAVPINFTEAIGAQIAYFIDVIADLKNYKVELKLTSEIGSAEPLAANVTDPI